MCIVDSLLIKKQRDGQKAEYCKKETLVKKAEITVYECPPKEQINADQWFTVCKKSWKSQKTKIDLEVRKILDCFLDGHGSYDSNLLPFKI